MCFLSDTFFYISRKFSRLTPKLQKKKTSVHSVPLPILKALQSHLWTGSLKQQQGKSTIIKKRALANNEESNGEENDKCNGSLEFTRFYTLIGRDFGFEVMLTQLLERYLEHRFLLLKPPLAFRVWGLGFR